MLTCYSRYFMSGAAVALIVSNGWSMAAAATDEDDGPQTFREHCERLESAEHEMRDRLAYTPYGEERERLQYRLGEIHQERERCWRR